MQSHLQIHSKFEFKLNADAEWSTLLVGYPKWKVDADSGKFPLAKMLRFRFSPVGLKRKIHKVSRRLTWTCTNQITFLPTSTEELSIPPTLSFTKDQRKR